MFSVSSSCARTLKEIVCDINPQRCTDPKIDAVFKNSLGSRPKLNPAAPDFRELQRWQNYETLEPATGLARAEQGPTFRPGQSWFESNLEIDTPNGNFSVDLQAWEMSELVQASGLRIPMGVWGSREILDYRLADQDALEVYRSDLEMDINHFKVQHRSSGHNLQFCQIRISEQTNRL
ncbi:hypothetical protein WR25_15132 isoform B [Diploscapter pachys]|uniref:Uncharacterized protein n=1 Tax=Diploscapter pachys TaxID=2018661 RepID=A0A2A2K463_9BILA|nr:hypothetical protein WR25_15132 isoform B [Diploscapter pachys]